MIRKRDDFEKDVESEEENEKPEYKKMRVETSKFESGIKQWLLTYSPLEKINPQMQIIRYTSQFRKGSRYRSETTSVIVQASRFNQGNVVFETEIVDDLPSNLIVQYHFKKVRFEKKFFFNGKEDLFRQRFEELFTKYSKLVPCKTHYRSDYESNSLFPSGLQKGDVLINPIRGNSTGFGVVALVFEECFVPAGCSGWCFCNKRHVFDEGYCNACMRFRRNCSKTNLSNSEPRVFGVFKISEEEELGESENRHLRNMSFMEVAKQVNMKYEKTDTFRIWMHEQMKLSLTHPNARRFDDYPLTLRSSINASVYGIKGITSGEYRNGKFDGTVIFPSVRTRSKYIDSLEYSAGIQEIPIEIVKFVLKKKVVKYFGFVLSGDAMYPNEGVWPATVGGFRVLMGGVDYNQTGLLEIVERYVKDLLTKPTSLLDRKKLKFYLSCFDHMKEKETTIFSICKRVTQLFLNFTCLLEDGKTYHFSFPCFYFLEDSTNYQQACGMIVSSLYYCFMEFESLQIGFDVFGVLWDGESGVSKFFKDFSVKEMDQIESEYGWYMELPLKYLPPSEQLVSVKVPFIKCVGHGKKGICSILRNSSTGMIDSKKSIVVPIVSKKLPDGKRDKVFGVASYYPLVKMYSIETSNIHCPKITRLTFDSIYPSKEKTMSERLAGQILCKNTLIGLDYYFLSKFKYPNNPLEIEEEIENEIKVTKKEILALQVFIGCFTKLRNVFGADRPATYVDLEIVKKHRTKLLKWRFDIVCLSKKKNIGVIFGLSKNAIRLEAVNLWVSNSHVYEYLFNLCENLGVEFYPGKIFNQKKLESFFGSVRTIEGLHQNPRTDEISQRIAKGILRLVTRLIENRGNSDQDMDQIDTDVLINSELSEIISSKKKKWEERLEKRIEFLKSKVFLFPEMKEMNELMSDLENKVYFQYVRYRTGNIIKNVIQSHQETSEFSRTVSSVFQNMIKKETLGDNLFTPIDWIVKEFGVWEHLFSTNFRLVLFRNYLCVFEEAISTYIYIRRKNIFEEFWNDHEVSKKTEQSYKKVGENIFRKLCNQFSKQRFFEALEICGLKCQKYRDALRRLVK